MFSYFHKLLETPLSSPSYSIVWCRRLSFFGMFTGLPLLFVGIVWGLFFSPIDEVQGYSVRIIYIHVPSAYMSTLGYGVMFVMGLFYLINRAVIADLISRSISPVGCVLTLVCLVTGSIWGKPTWGTYWVWDARLTSMLLLFFLYLGHIFLARAYGGSTRGCQAIAVLSLIGGLNLPIIKFSVDWWNTLHQPASIFRMDGPAIHASMLTPLLLMMLAFTLFFIWMVAVRLETLLSNRIRESRQMFGTR